MTQADWRKLKLQKTNKAQIQRLRKELAECEKWENSNKLSLGEREILFHKVNNLKLDLDLALGHIPEGWV